MLIRNSFESKKWITLIALIITIIVLLILAGISISTLLGSNGIIEKAVWSSFSTEMTAIREAVDIEVSSKYLEIKQGNIDVFTDVVPVEELSTSLKQEIQYVSNSMKDADKPSNYDEEDIYFMADENGNLRRFHYISTAVSGQSEEKVYIYMMRIETSYIK